MKRGRAPGGEETVVPAGAIGDIRPMNVKALDDAGDRGRSRADWRWAVLLLLPFAPALLIAAHYRALVAAAYFTALAALVMLAFPRLLFTLFLISIGLFLPYYVTDTMAISPADLLLALLAVIALLDFLLRDSTAIRLSRIDGPFLALIGGTVISAFFAHNQAYSIIPVVRIVVVYAAYHLTFKFGSELGVRCVLRRYVLFVAALSLINAVLFVLAGGRERVFGPAWLGYEPLSMTALPMAVTFAVWAERHAERLRYIFAALLIGFGMLAAGSRGPMLAVLLVVPLLMFFGWRKARREQTITTRRVLRGMLLPLVAILALVIVLQELLFTGLIDRIRTLVESIGDPQETVLLRVVLAKAAIGAFLSDPLTGIGIGNFRVVDEVVPQIRLEPVWFYIRGMSAHNVLLHYLAETGLLGAVPLVLLALTGVRTAYRCFRRPLAHRHQQVSAALFAGMLVFAITLLYMRAWTWGQEGYVMGLLFGLTAAWAWETEAGPPDTKGPRGYPPAET